MHADLRVIAWLRERYLKINTQAPERENRRVAIRRITPLVAPVDEQVLR